MDDRAGKKKQANLVCHLLLGSSRHRPVVSFLFLITFLFNYNLSAAQIDTAARAGYTCNSDTTTAKGRVKCAEWYDSGDLQVVKIFRNGLRHGTWSYYLPGRVLDKRVKYKRGKLIFELHYNEDGKLYKTIDKRGKVRYKKKCNCL